MSLDLAKLENVVVRQDRVIARCPACAENGEDETGNHLFIADGGDGKFGCVVNAGEAGHSHRTRIAELAGVRSSGLRSSYGTLTCRGSSPKLPAQKPPRSLVPLQRPSEDALDAINALRGWHSVSGLQVLVERGLLWDANIYDNETKWPAWVISDSKRINEQARTYDGSLWHGIGGKKAKSLPGSVSSWPIGAPEIGQRPNVILCEGQPDFCAALVVASFERPELVDRIAPVCMTGAGNSIHADALKFFEGKRVRIMTHSDAGDQGKQASQRWSDQLYYASAESVTWVDFSTLGLVLRNGRPIKDLADYATLLDCEFQTIRGLFDQW